MKFNKELYREQKNFMNMPECRSNFLVEIMMC